MFVTRQDILTLKTLSTTKNIVDVNSIPANLKNEFQLYFFGKTLLKMNGSLFAYPHDVKLWVNFLFKKYKH
jgi:uncharacterized Rmd1/YagE family protein